MFLGTMASSSNQTSAGNEEEDEFPIAAIICLAVGAYVIIIIAIIVIKQMLSSRGTCKSECCQPVEDGRRPCCCTLCAKAGESCTCCGNCHINGCLTKICGKPKRTNCIDILLCNCGGCTENCCNFSHIQNQEIEHALKHTANRQVISLPLAWFPEQFVGFVLFCYFHFGCKCSCSCLQNIKCSTCCAPSSSPFCSTCRNCCSDICCDAPDTGVCGCLCLEVKLRSPRHGSSRRSQSAPPVNGNDGKHFSTHFPPKRDIEGQISLARNGSAGDYMRSEASSETSTSNLKLRSTSLSPSKTRDSFPSSRNENTSSKVSKTALLSRTNSSKISDERIEVNTNYSNRNNLNSHGRPNSARGHDESRLQGNQRTSRHRKSLRVGQQSQRFPQHVLVSLESNGNRVDLSRSPSDQNDVKFYSMPVQKSVSKRPLPPLKDTSRSTKLSKTH